MGCIEDAVRISEEYNEIDALRVQIQVRDASIAALTADNEKLRAEASCLDQSVRDNEKLDAENKALHALISHLRNDTSPRTTADVLEKLAEASDLLLDRYDYDGLGYEGICHARSEARVLIGRFRTAELLEDQENGKYRQILYAADGFRIMFEAFVMAVKEGDQRVIDASIKLIDGCKAAEARRKAKQ